MSEHTPGPWRLGFENLRGGGYWGVLRADKFEPIDIHESENAEADARLISAAPDLLAALKVAREYVVRIDGTLAFTAPEARVTRPDLNLIDAAIAKATGATS